MLKLQCNEDLECLDEEDKEDYQGSVNPLGVIMYIFFSKNLDRDKLVGL